MSSEKRIDSAATRGCSTLLLLASACAASASARGGPTSLGLSGRATLAAYLAAIPPTIKMRHQVETRFGTRSEVVEGFCVLARPDQFWVRAMSPLGGTLFDVKGTRDGHVELDTPLDSIADARGPFYLARDIRRIYLENCPADADIKPVRDGFRVSCSLKGETEPGSADPGLEPPDDAMAEILSPSGIVWEKELYRGGEPTAVVHYDDYREVQGLWLAHRITLTGHTALYSLTILLLDADVTFDAARLFAKPATSP